MMIVNGNHYSWPLFNPLVILAIIRWKLVPIYHLVPKWSIEGDCKRPFIDPPSFTINVLVIYRAIDSLVAHIERG